MMNKTKTFSKNIGRLTRTTVLSIAVLTLGLSLTIIEWRNAVDVVFMEDQLRFEQETDKSLLNIQKQMETYQQVLRGIKGLFVASDNVNRTEFKAYTEELALEHTYPGILGVGFSLSIAPSQRAEHIASIRAEGFPNYVMLPKGEREQYTSIIYLEPFSGNNLNAFGFDMYSEKVRRAAMDKSRATNKLALSGKVSLVQDVDRGPISGVLLYLPVYQDNDEQVGVIPENLYGWVYAPFSMDILMEGILSDKLKINLNIYDGTVINKKTQLYSSMKNAQEFEEMAFQQTEQLVIAQRIWTVVFSADKNFVQSHVNTEGIIVLLIGSLFSLLLTLVVWSLSTSKNRAEAKAESMNKELSETEFRWKSALSGAEHGVWDWDNLTNSVTFDTKWKSMLGYADDEIKNEFSEWKRLLHPEDWERAEVAIANFVSGKTNIYNLEQRLQAKDGKWIWILCRGDAVSWTDDGRVARSIGTHTDITEQKKLELALTESDLRFRGAFETAAMGIALVGLNGEWIEVNPSLLNMLQYSEEELLKLTFQDITHPEDLNLDLEHLTALVAGEIKSYQMEKRYFCKDGSIVWAFLSVSMVVDIKGKPVHFVSQIENITVRKELQKQVLHQASHDELTGLPNRRFLKDRLARTYELSRRYKRPFALMYIDVDHFKLVNDEYGHDVGDDLLIWLSSKLKSCLRGTDTLARQGGDEFVLILSEIKSSEDATLIANNIFEAISDVFSNGILKRQVSLSIGIAISDPAGDDSIEDLLRKADIALYQVKRAGRNAFKHYQDGDDKSS
ncbi:CHASE domain-containing protein [Colwellia sp. 1_MG-2023]|uniref:sensor domain-containing diguanylate cyclase n=1 Tax=unclassified Colwellia TaxID=196834 RepID=UPI001C0924ED|nr:MULTISPECIES: CHASE domain-containing protein [unclassified Colwellia]MBU2923433.1 CHASE domain-containing protein [Colwellia sp. C2M11]MDO6653793.1 CHASE domain-containing protein [Colwellia sp. 3_MG-2023]MDO6666695.1 CHASE domain-containing protein [Colwellia sp. 2_MG-2023]MDO6691136.1 CHASE domain-containing protein [Colwellia sp. 1_MG-2023]